MSIVSYQKLTRKEYLLLVLGILTKMGKQVFESRTRLMKMLYLLSREKKELVQEITRDNYEFEWYLFGPFSKDVLFDLEELEEEGYIDILPEDMGTYIQYNYALTHKGLKYLKELSERIPKKILNNLRDYLNKFRHMTAAEIKQYVYKRYLYS